MTRDIQADQKTVRPVKPQPDAVQDAAGDAIERERERMLLRDAAVDIAMKQTGITFWILDLEKQLVLAPDDLSNVEPDKKMAALRRNIENVHPDDREEAQSYFMEIFAGREAEDIEIRVRFASSSEYIWGRITHTFIKDAHGDFVKAVGSLLDISEQKRLRRAFEEQMSFKRIAEQKMVNHCRLNLSKNMFSTGNVSIATLEHMLHYATVDDFFAHLYPVIARQQRQEFAEIFSRENLLQSFATGKTSLQGEHKFLIDDRRIWMESHADIMRNPETGDVEVLFYSFDIDDSKKMQQLIQNVAEKEYGYLSMIDMKHDEYHIYYSKEAMADERPPLSGVFTAACYKRAMGSVTEDTRDEYLKQLDFDYIRHRLSEEERLIVFFKIVKPDGSIGNRKIQLFYIDREEELLCATYRDITDIVVEEEKKADIIKEAWEAAKQANAAKSDFLSRMSHEIRTPLNAIIGMTTIATKRLGDEKQVGDCLGKIGLSSRFLLTLINDILDMSRIESGKVFLKNEKIPFEEFINGINSICCSQAQGKGVDYENIVDAHLDDYYLGDAMKLQQILINILSNAIKFTPAGGKVTLQLREKKRVKDNAILEFTINDTGCGMNQEFLPKLFEPFAQEYSGSTAIYGGTGLGMAITKTFVDLMDGHINVRSMLGIGSEFTVDVKLGLTNESKKRRDAKHRHDFSKLTALVVDDDVVVCEQAVITLQEIGLLGSWVSSGNAAVSLVKEKWERQQYFDFILIDWKMPEMDGIETARQIRKVVGPDVTIIIITAYDWIAIEEEAKQAGVNMLVNKPLFKSSLISAFQKVMEQKDEIQEAPVEFDFTGKRVLLAEDNLLNAEIAEFLLNDKGLEVDIANNGVKAVEMFTLQAPGYYDAILMDIRMPIMDGLQATVNIRHLDKKDAATIPIIAMTANAFEDDVIKSKQAGMQAHIIKPIEPEHLYEALARFWD